MGTRSFTVKPRRSVQGFTMAELLIAMAISGILLMVAVPSFQEAALSSQLRAASNNLLVASVAARSEAIKRNAVVELCPSADGSTCGGSWEAGWIVSCLSSDNIICGAGGANRLVLHAESSAGPGIRVIAQGGATSLSFQPSGAAATAQTFKICREHPLGAQERVLVLTGTGRGSVKRTTTKICP